MFIDWEHTKIRIPWMRLILFMMFSGVFTEQDENFDKYFNIAKGKSF